MPPITDLPPLDVVRLAGSLFGSIGSMLFVRDADWLRRLAMFVSGTGFSYGSVPWFAVKTNIEAGFFLAFILALGSMAVFGKFFETLHDFAFGKFVSDLLYRYTGVKPRD